jgi:hypothetical protein
MANRRRTPAEHRTASVVAAVVLAALVIVPIVGVAWLVASTSAPRDTRSVRMSTRWPRNRSCTLRSTPRPWRDPHRKRRTRRHRAGPTNSISTARRGWALGRADWQDALLDTVEDVDQHDVTWWSLSCSPLDVVFHGRTDVVVGDEALFGIGGRWGVRARQPRTVPQDQAQQRGNRPSGARRAKTPGTRLGDECPTAVSEAFASLQA